MAAREEASLLWLWIVLGLIGAGVIAVAAYFIAKYYMNKDKPKTDNDL